MRLVLATLGSLGDLHPFLALGLGLHQRGHHVTLATSPLYREKVESEGLHFAPLRPDLPPPSSDNDLIRRVMDSRNGTRAVISEWCMPALRESYADLTAACTGADLLINHSIVFSGPLLSEKTGLPFLSAVLQPIVFFSADDPCVPPTTPGWQNFADLPKPLVRFVYGQGWRMTRRWLTPVDDLRRELGLPATRRHPLIEGQFSPRGTLALFSSALAAPQADWPMHTTQTGFAFYDALTGGSAPSLAPALRDFLAAGPPPIVFTLGSSAVMTAGDFFAVSAAAAARLGQRAVLLTGRDQPVPNALPPGILAVPYAPYSQLLPHAAVIVHQGGVGTTGQALRAGRPQVIVPFAHDQPDHAARITRRGLGATVLRDRYTLPRVTATLERVLSDPPIAARATEVGAQVQHEDGVAAACAAIEKAL